MALLIGRRPLTVILDITERCNLKCRMCHFAATDRIQFPPFDRSLSSNGMMPVEVFEKIAADLFPRAWRVALSCAAEPLIHPKFEEIVRIAGRYKVGDLWFPTNLLALTESKMQTICEAGVTRVGVSIDGTQKETYEHIRVGGRFDRLEKALTLFGEVRARQPRRRRPQLRITFTWMQSNRDDLHNLPEFAQRWGASEIDVRFVVPTPGVDVEPELLRDEPEVLRRELASVAHDAVARGVRLYSYPDFQDPDAHTGNPIAWLRNKLWRRRSGLDRWEYTRYRSEERLHGCVWPRHFVVIRPNGAVSPCIFWQEAPIGFYPEDDRAAMEKGEVLPGILEGLSSGSPVGTCRTCSQRKDAFYYRLRKWTGRSDEPELTKIGK